MLKALYRSVMATMIFVVILCMAYPFFVYGLSKLMFFEKANGGIIYRAGKPVGARLIGQGFTKPEYFHGRPSAAGSGYDAANSSGSNLGPTNQKFSDGLVANVDAVLKENPKLQRGDVPAQLVTASGSGLDPHLSPEAVRVQVDRVAAARGISPDSLHALIRDSVEGPQWGLFGEPVVNVLELNLALDEKFPLKK